VRLYLHYGDLTDSSHITNVFYEVRPDEIDHLDAQSHVRVSFDIPVYTGDVSGLGTVWLLEAIRKSGVRCRLYKVMGVQLVEHARRFRVEKLVLVGTVCAYPKFTPVSFREDVLWSGYPAEANGPYSLAKNMLLVKAQVYRQEYDCNERHAPRCESRAAWLDRCRVACGEATSHEI
jgi:GDP-D-mannose dehydratase